MLKMSESEIRDELRKFISANPDWIEIIKGELHGRNSNGVFVVLRYLNTKQLQEIFEELVYFASTQSGHTLYFRNLILSLPHDWVLERIENFVEPILETGDYREYRGVLDLYWELDKGLAKKIADRAKKSDDYDIREAGLDFLEALNKYFGH